MSKRKTVSAGVGSGALPKIIVFDLDGTLWYPEMYMLWSGGGSPFKPHPQRPDRLLDRSGTEVKLMGNSYDLMRSLALDPVFRDQGVTFGVASTCDEPEWAAECMQKLMVTTSSDEGGQRNMTNLFHFNEIYKASSKQTHFRNIQKKAKAHYGQEIAFKDMIFFDNQTDNTRSVSKLGVHCVYTPDGMTEEHWIQGLEQWRAAHGRHSDL